MREGLGKYIVFSALLILVFVPNIVLAGYIGMEISISTKEYDQQNPYVLFLPDKNLYFVAWEDWRNQLSTKADIYGRFLKPDGTSCGDEFIISNSIGNQTVPVAAYRDGAVQSMSTNRSDKILVVWQDTRRTTTDGLISDGLIYYRSIDVSSITEDCSNYILGAEVPVRFEDDDPLLPGIQSKTNSRMNPKVVYDLINDRFMIAWVESRTTLKTSKFKPFPLNDTEPFWQFGDSQFVGYGAIKGDLTGYETLPTIITQWMEPSSVARDTFTRARLINRSSGPFEVVSEFEFFDNISNVDISCDSTSPECLIVWEGRRGIFKRTDTCIYEVPDDFPNICDSTDAVASTATTEYKPVNTEVFGIFEKNIPPNSVYSTRISYSDAGAHSPSIGFDPISKRFLVAWEDLRTIKDVSKAPYTKIFGQLIYSGSGLYNQNFIISYQDTDGDGKQDLNVLNSRQTRPFVSYDAVNQRYFVVWQDGRNSTLSLENLDIYGQKVDAEGSLRGDNYAVYNLPFNQLAPVIANNPIMDEFLAVWKDARNTDKSLCGEARNRPCGSDVFGQLFTLGQPSITLLNIDNTPLSPPILRNFENPPGSGSVKIGTFAAQSFKIKNTGDVLLKIDHIDQTCGGMFSDISPFSIENLPSALVDRGGSAVELVPSAELRITVMFKPLQPGSYNKCFIIESDGGNIKVNISAFAIAPRAGINVSPESVDFPAITVDSVADKILTVINSGNFELIISEIVNPEGDFSISDSSCSGTLQPSESCTLTVSFNPKKTGFQQSTLTIKSNDPEVPNLNVPLTGIGRSKAQKIVVLPSAIDFGVIPRKTVIAEKIIIGNDGGFDLLIKGISRPKRPFTITKDTCSGQTIKAGASCEVEITFSPLYRGSYKGSITIKSNDPARPKGVKVSLRGTATL